jgi:hypothetical protein
MVTRTRFLSATGLASTIPRRSSRRALSQHSHHLLDFRFQPRNALSGEQVHARRTRELGQFPLERKQALVSRGNLSGLRACCWRRMVRRRMQAYPSALSRCLTIKGCGT